MNFISGLRIVEIVRYNKAIDIQQHMVDQATGFKFWSDNECILMKLWIFGDWFGFGRWVERRIETHLRRTHSLMGGMSDRFCCGDTSAWFKLLEIISQLMKFLKLNLFILYFLVNVFKTWNVESFLIIYLERFLQKLPKVPIFGLRKRYFLGFH